ncbi:uncharacterized protein LOC142620529 [Castanea sativa]|uniref:uncharacterized protein LOC142620529 n=1 Tax=Castanea sativa TaxID=21020 RepID=UPI003F650869
MVSTGIKLEHSLKLGFHASNNKVEYEALAARLQAAMKLGVVELEVFSNSDLVVSQVEGSFEAWDPKMAKYQKLVHSLGRSSHADSLATLASSVGDYIPQIILVELLEHLSIDHQRCIVATSTASLSWMDPIISFISDGTLPSEHKEVEKVRRKLTRFWLSVEKRLYRQSFRGTYLLCMHPEVVTRLLAGLHEGICGSYIGGWSLAHRVMA